ncbi:unnamed protein product [Aphanomyces euteiches]|uniref:Uncharacterized protein n=1 Tax=Aphanomyces euteiches TaxID=100861 RepID=A0A6G0XVK0_9STRA|nr:hypothetical protein Ae201684_000988 [Aphanomyces euteiches]KAH9099799.1 hypothetical protein Ae201684P_018809 [Aphanomyces euteiches]KAH9134541.1 hypothetical protein AeRB84_019699 [Aphanomyces euteiches]
MTILDVLLSPDLLCTVCDFQNGTYHPNHPLKTIPTPRIRRGAVFENWAKEDLKRIDGAISPWLAIHGLCRLPSLLHVVQRRIVAIHAVYFGHTRTLKALLKLVTFDSICENLIDWAAFHGNLEVIQFLDAFCSNAKQTRLFWCVCSDFAMDLAATEGHLHVIQWLHQSVHRRNGCTAHAIDGAARNGHLEVVQWLFLHSKPCTAKAVDTAAAAGHLDVVKWLTHRGMPATKTAMNYAATAGHLEIVQWLDANRSEGCTTEAMDGAARHGHHEVVQWLHLHRREGCTIDAVDGAARNGHLDVVAWLLVHRREKFTKHAIRRATQNGHKDVADFLRHQRSCVIQ